MQKPSHPEIIMEDKLIILYALSFVKTGLTRTRLAEIILQNIQLNYFDFQWYVDQMINDGLLNEMMDDQGQKKIILTSEGLMTIKQLSETIPIYLRELLDLYIEQNKDRLLERIRIDAAVEENGPGDYTARLSITENNLCLLAMTINTPTKSDAIDLCKKWQTDPQKYYAAVIKCFNQ